jgi:N-acetylglucosamine-6-phosphate deacetylase
MRFVLSGARVFDGTHLREGVSVVVADGRVVAAVADGEAPPDAERREVQGLLAPGFIDTQVNGGGGVFFNDRRTREGIAAIGAAHRKYGTTGFLPTLITATTAHMREALAATREAIAAKVPGVLGIHLEGPFLNPARKGVHDPKLFRAPEDSDFALATSLGVGRTMLTLAPECVPVDMIRRLSGAGVLLSAGHTAASYEAVIAARDAGLTGVTHLFNAMPPMGGRDPGPVGAALDEPDLFAGIIVDLFHVSAPSLRAALSARGWQRTMLVTDAMPTVGTDIKEFIIDGNVITRRDGRLTRVDGTIAGSDLDMATAVRNTVNVLGLPLEAALHMASGAPAAYLRLDHELGRIAPGYRADLVLLDDGLNVVETWIGGVVSNG